MGSTRSDEKTTDSGELDIAPEFERDFDSDDFEEEAGARQWGESDSEDGIGDFDEQDLAAIAHSPGADTRIDSEEPDSTEKHSFPKADASVSHEDTLKEDSDFDFLDKIQEEEASTPPPPAPKAKPLGDAKIPLNISEVEREVRFVPPKTKLALNAFLAQTRKRLSTEAEILESLTRDQQIGTVDQVQLQLVSTLRLLIFTKQVLRSGSPESYRAMKVDIEKVSQHIIDLFGKIDRKEYGKKVSTGKAGSTLRDLLDNYAHVLKTIAKSIKTSS